MESDLPNTIETWNEHVDQEHLKSMAKHVWGPDATAMVENHVPQDALLMKYQHNIVDMEQALKGKRVLDIGCNHGLWSYMAHRHGAEHVVGLEPRGMFVKGLNAFAKEKQLPMEFVQGYETDALELIERHSIDTVLLMSMEALVPWERLMYDIRHSRAEWIIMQTAAFPDEWLQPSNELKQWIGCYKDKKVQGYTVQFRMPNATVRSALDPIAKDKVDPDTGYRLTNNGQPDPAEVSEIRWTKSRGYIENFLEHAEFETVKVTAQDQDVKQTVGSDALLKLMQWWLIRNKK
jgi:SAM-dependent methyltransferase